MKRANGFLVILGLVMVFALTTNVMAATSCTLDAKLINQDPYPAVPGDYVKVVFQVTGVDNPACGMVNFQLLPSYPFSLDPSQNASISINSGTYVSDYQSALLVPYKLRISPDVISGDNEIKVSFAGNMQTGTSSYITKTFNIAVNKTSTDFELSVKDYDKTTNIITFDILNIGSSNVEALTVDAPVQNTLDVKGSRRDIVGSLDKNDDATFTYEATPKDGSISLVILYNDAVNQRHQIEKSVMFNSADFLGRVKDKKSYTGTIVLVIIILAVIGIFLYRRRQKQKKVAELRNSRK